jgi:hypothetical protein
MITSVDTQDWTENQNNNRLRNGRGRFEYSIDGTYFQDSNQFSNIVSGQYTVHVRDKNGCATVTDEVYLLMYPKFFTQTAMDLMTLGKSNFQIMKLAKHSTI